MSMRPRASRRERAAAWGALTLLAAAAGFAFSPNERAGPQSAAQRHAERAAAASVAAQGTGAARRALTAPVTLLTGASQVARGGAATRVRVSSVGIDAEVRSVGFVLQGGQLQYDTPRFEAGQYVGTADPGRPGNLVIGGHVANRGALAVFSRLPEVRIGDVVEVFSGPAIYRYSVTELRVVAADATAVMARTQEATLTLITCFPDQDYARRLVVIGKLL
jgi:LPXTG-site transpeptidase (sortase) family protein